MCYLGLEKAEEPEIKLPSFIRSQKKQKNSRKNIYFCFIDYANLYAGQEATVRTGHGKTGWFQIGKGVHQSCILSPCLFNLYAEYIRRSTTLEEAQAGIKILGDADDTTLMAETEEKLKSLLMKVKVESEKVVLKLNVQNTKIMASGSITSWEIDEETVETISDFIFWGS